LSIYSGGRMAVPNIWRKIPEYYNLIGKRCPECNELYFPQRDVCLKCGAFNLEDFKFIGKGEVVTYTIIRTTNTNTEEENLEIPARNIPYILAIVKLEQGPMLTCQIVDLPPEDIEIGQQVEVVFRKIMERGKKGVIQYGYKFRRAK